jgi:hypothetical protein
MEDKSNGINDSITRLKSSNTKDISTVKNGNTDDENELDDHSTEIVELNNRIKNDFMSYCLSFLHDDEEGRECVQIVWNKYLQCVGDVAIVSRRKIPNSISSFFFRYLHFLIHFHIISNYPYYQNIKMKFLIGVKIYFILIVKLVFIQHIIQKYFHV